MNDAQERAMLIVQRNAGIYEAVIMTFAQWIWENRSVEPPKWDHTRQKVILDFK